MSYISYAYGNGDQYNLSRDGMAPPPSDIMISAGSTATTLILTKRNEPLPKLIIEGQFQYNSIKQIVADVTFGMGTVFKEYDDGTLTFTEAVEPALAINTYLYGSYRELVTLFSGDDYISGSPSQPIDDFTRGLTGNDTFIGYGSGPQGDYFDGESGFDKAILRGKSSEYQISSTSFNDRLKSDGTTIQGFMVTDSKANRDGVDYYANVERLYFNDKVVALDINGNAGHAYRLYQAALDRTPDERGLAGWIKFMDEDGSLVAMSQQFIDSQEFRTKYGALDNAKFVNQLYLNVLDRNGEPNGVAGWVNGLANGLTRADVLKGFSESSENQANVIGQIKNGIPYVEWWLA